MNAILEKVVAGALLVALVLLVVQLMQPPAQLTSSDAAVDDMVMDDSGVLENRVAALEAALAASLEDRQAKRNTDRTLRVLRKRLKSLEAQLAEGPRGPRSRRLSNKQKRKKKAPKYVSLESPFPKLEVSQKPDGSLLIRNRDPALTGQLVTVKATLANGKVKQLQIGVPRVR